MILVAQPLLGEDEFSAVQRVLMSGQLAQGEQVAEFERRFAETHRVKHAVALSSGTAALHMALLAHGIGMRDEVITTPFSFAATANCILAVGAKPVFVDIQADTYNIDPECITAAITPRTKAIIPVHLYGNPADMQAIGAIAEQFGLMIIEDACQAHGAAINGVPVGGAGTGCFSFYSTKNMTTGEGGMVTTNDALIANQIRLLRSHGQKERYLHIALGYNLRLTELQAAIGLVQLAKLDQFTAWRIANAELLTSLLAPYVTTPIARPGHRHVYHQYTIRVPSDRDRWVATLHEHGIGTSIHYPRPIHLQPYFRELGYTDVLPVAEAAAREVLSLPIHPGLSEDEVRQIAQEVIALCHP